MLISPADLFRALPCYSRSDLHRYDTVNKKGPQRAATSLRTPDEAAQGAGVRQNERKETMRVIASTATDGVLADCEKTLQHNASSGKAPCVVKQYDSTGLWILVQYSSGAPAAWVGQRAWVPNLLLTSI